MSPSRLSAGMTSGSPADEISSANVASISCGSYGTSGCRSAAASISSFSIPSYVGLTVYFGPPNTFAPGLLGLAERELGDRAADAPLDPLRPERDLVVALALTPLLRAVGVADRHAHDRDRCVHAAERNDARESGARFARSPSRRSPRAGCGSASRRRRAPPGVIVAAFRPRPCSRIACAASWTTWFWVARRDSSERSKRGNSRSSPVTSGARTRRALLEQLLPGFVALEHHDRFGVHGSGH